MNNHVMLDLETWGTFPGCAIRSIGACLFDPYGDPPAQVAPENVPNCYDLFYRNVTDVSCTRAGLTQDPGTVQWWGEQGAEAQMALVKNAITLGDALRDFSQWFVDNKGLYLWAHGATFDPPVLEAAYRAIGLKPPWKYRYVRDTRTMFDLPLVAPIKATPPLIAHHALYDAIAQTIDLQIVFRNLRDALTPPCVVDLDVLDEKAAA